MLHNVVEEFEEQEQKEELANEHIVEDATYEDDDYDENEHNHHHHHHEVKQTLESFDFNDVESIMWRKVCIILILSKSSCFDNDLLIASISKIFSR